MNILYEYMTFLSGRQRKKTIEALVFCIFSVFFIRFAGRLFVLRTGPERIAGTFAKSLFSRRPPRAIIRKRPKAARDIRPDRDICMKGNDPMKKLLILVLTLLLVLPAAQAETVSPFEVMTLDAAAETAAADHPLILRGVDFGEGAAILRFKAVTDSELTVRVCLDSAEEKPIATALFRPMMKENRRNIAVSGIHDLYIVLEGSGTLTTLQAFNTAQEIEAAIRMEQGGHYEDAIPVRYTRDCEHAGTVEKFTYQAHDYFHDGALYEKAAYVYLPFGYDPQNTYDLLILCHGIGGSEAEWGLPSKPSRVRQIMDNLIDSGEIRPFIVVTPNGRAGKTDDYSSFYSFDKELREDLLPALAKAYAVDITDRNRCAMAGLSMGGMQTINLGIGSCLDLFSAFGAFSAAPTSNGAAATAAVLNAHPDLPVRVFYNICGTEDSIALVSAASAFQNLDTMTDRLNDQNFFVQLVPGGHDFTVWYLGFYNFARMIGAPEAAR